MKNIQNAVSEALHEIHANRNIREEITEDPNHPGTRWVVLLVLGQKRMEFEIMKSETNVFGAVLHREGFSSNFEETFMDSLMECLED